MIFNCTVFIAFIVFLSSTEHRSTVRHKSISLRILYGYVTNKTFEPLNLEPRCKPLYIKHWHRQSFFHAIVFFKTLVRGW